MFNRLSRVIAATAVITILSLPGAVANAAPSKPITNKKTKALDLRRKAVLDLYARQKELQYRYLTNRTSTLLVPKEGSKVYTGVRFDSARRSEARDQADGVYLDMRPEQYESFDLRIASLSTTTAVLRVCERTSGYRFRKLDNQRSDANVSTVYTCQVEAGRDPATQKRRYRTATAPTRRDANSLLHDLMKEVAGEVGRVEEGTTMTLGALIERWLELGGPAAASTRQVYAGYIKNQIKPHLWDVRLDRLKVADNEFGEAVFRGEVDPAGNPYAGPFLEAFEHGRVDLAMVGCGESASLIGSIKTVGEIIDETVAVFWEQIERLARLLPHHEVLSTT